jgi:hypothetical protein
VFTVSKSGDLSGVAKGLERAAVQGQKAAGRAVAKEGRKVLLDDVRRTRGTLRMMGGNLAVKTRVTAGAVSSVVELYGSPAGPWTIVNKGTRSYDVRPKRKAVLAAGRGDIIGMKAHHRARRGRDYWGMASGRLDAEMFDVVAETVDPIMQAAS